MLRAADQQFTAGCCNRCYQLRQADVVQRHDVQSDFSMGTQGYRAAREQLSWRALTIFGT